MTFFKNLDSGQSSLEPKPITSFYMRNGDLRGHVTGPIQVQCAPVPSSHACTRTHGQTDRQTHTVLAGSILHAILFKPSH